MMDHEKLLVYQKSLKFVEWTDELISKVNKKINVIDHLDRASTSIVLNIAEGNGKFTSRDRCKFFDISRGSALECAGCLDVIIRRTSLTKEEIIEGKQLLKEIISMLVGLIKSNSDRVFEYTEEYNALEK
jgi:four helix bundle protein